MGPRQEVKPERKAPVVRTGGPKPRLQIVKLEERITPRIATNHNETLAREPAKAAEVRKDTPKPKLQIVKLEERIAPRLSANRNETLACDGSANAR